MRTSLHLGRCEENSHLAANGKFKKHRAIIYSASDNMASATRPTFRARFGRSSEYRRASGEAFNRWNGMYAKFPLMRLPGSPMTRTQHLRLLHAERQRQGYENIVHEGGCR